MNPQQLWTGQNIGPGPDQVQPWLSPAQPPPQLPPLLEQLLAQMMAANPKMARAQPGAPDPAGGAIGPAPADVMSPAFQGFSTLEVGAPGASAAPWQPDVSMPPAMTERFKQSAAEDAARRQEAINALSAPRIPGDEITSISSADLTAAMERIAAQADFTPSTPAGIQALKRMALLQAPAARAAPTYTNALDFPQQGAPGYPEWLAAQKAAGEAAGRGETVREPGPMHIGRPDFTATMPAHRAERIAGAPERKAARTEELEQRELATRAKSMQGGTDAGALAAQRVGEGGKGLEDLLMAGISPEAATVLQAGDPAFMRAQMVSAMMQAAMSSGQPIDIDAAVRAAETLIPVPGAEPAEGEAGIYDSVLAQIPSRLQAQFDAAVESKSAKDMAYVLRMAEVPEPLAGQFLQMLSGKGYWGAEKKESIADEKGRSKFPRFSAGMMPPPPPPGPARVAPKRKPALLPRLFGAK